MPTSSAASSLSSSWAVAWPGSIRVPPEGLLKAAEYVEAVQSRQGYYIACLEEIAYRRGFIDAAELRRLGDELGKTAYGKYLLNVADEAERGVA